jgi:hypothetical protein
MPNDQKVLKHNELETRKMSGDFVSVRPDMSGPYIAAVVGARHASPSFASVS